MITLPALADLQALAPLAKPHYSWPFQFVDPDPTDPTGERKICQLWTVENRPILREFARITRSLPLSLEFYKLPQVAACAEAMRGTDSTICLTCTPSYLASVRVSDWSQTYADAMRKLAGLLEGASTIFDQAKLKVGAFMLDIETWRTPPYGSDNVHELGAKHVAIERLVSQRFPSAVYLCYNRGSVGYSGLGLGEMGYLPRGGRHPYTPSLYYQEHLANRAVLDATCELAKADGVPSVVPFVSLGRSQPRGRNQWQPDTNDALPFGAWQVGFELARDPRVSAVAFWPGPFSNPGWGGQFVGEYCPGAAGLK